MTTRVWRSLEAFVRPFIVGASLVEIFLALLLSPPLLAAMYCIVAAFFASRRKPPIAGPLADRNQESIQ